MPDQQKSLLWEISKDSILKGYLFGTMHVRSDRAFTYADQILGFMQNCEIYAAEMDLGSADPDRLNVASQLPEGQTLKSYLTDKQFAKVQKSILKSFGIDLRFWLHRHPFLTVSMLSELLLENDHLLALDHYLWNEAKKMEMEMHGLESFDEQMNVMETMKVEDHVKHLRSVARSPRKFRRQILSLVASYEAHDIRGIYKSSKKQLQNLRRKMLYDRNVVMADRVVKLMENGILFSAFGAAHLGGNKGVIAIMKKQGLQLKPVKLKLSTDKLLSTG